MSLFKVFINCYRSIKDFKSNNHSGRGDKIDSYLAYLEKMFSESAKMPLVVSISGISFIYENGP